MEDDESVSDRKRHRAKSKRIYLHDVTEEWEGQKLRFIGPDQYRCSDQDFARHLLLLHGQMCHDTRCVAASATDVGTRRTTAAATPTMPTSLLTSRPRPRPTPRLLDPPAMQPLSGSASGPRPLQVQLHSVSLRPMPRLTPIKLKVIRSQRLEQEQQNQQEREVLAGTGSSSSISGPTTGFMRTPHVLENSLQSSSDSSRSVSSFVASSETLQDHTYFRRPRPEHPGQVSQQQPAPPSSSSITSAGPSSGSTRQDISDTPTFEGSRDSSRAVRTVQASFQSLQDHMYTRSRHSTSVSATSKQTVHPASSLEAQEVPDFDLADTSTPIHRASGSLMGETMMATRKSKKSLFPLAAYSEGRAGEEPEEEPIASDSDDDMPAESTHLPDPELQRTLEQNPPTELEQAMEGLDVEVFDIEMENEVEDSEVEDGDQEAGDKGQAVEGLSEESEEEVLVSQKMCIVYQDKLMDLLKSVYGEECNICRTRYAYRSVKKGTAIVVTWECQRRHKGSWTSQPRYRGMFAGNLHTTSAIIMSGNSFQKIATMSKFLNLRMMNKRTFERIQKRYVAPAIEKIYQAKQDELLGTYKEPVILSGDGRSDSPGHSATYCTYSFCDEASRKILHSNTVMVQEASGKSPNMERIAFERGMDFLMSRITIEKIVTDAHPQIGALMKKTEKYSAVKHQWDVWHGSKNLTKKVTAAAQQKNCQELQPWVRKISNHFWYCSQVCDGNKDKLVGDLAGMLHHIVGEHEWIFTLDGRPGRCQHGQSEESNIAYLAPGSPAHEKLRTIIMDKRFMKNLHYYEDFLHTGSLESFHATLLMYASKRSYFTFLGYGIRVKLAVLDVNFHSDRKQAVTKEGKLRWTKRWNKRTKRFTVAPIREPKTYAYIPEVIVAVFKQRAITPGHLSQHVSLAEDDPRREHPTIAMMPSASISQLVEEHRSRYLHD